ncbi:MAG: permease-like cell division protein FtsX [bacterium]
MNWTNIRRILSQGATTFVRSGSVSFATVLIMTVTLGIIAFLIFLSAVLNFTLDSIKDKVDVNVYFVTTAATSDINALKDKLEKLPEVREVTYTSREQALADFTARHASDQLTLQALDELGENPLGANLAVKAKDPSQYEGIVSFLGGQPALSSDGASIIDRINYQQNKTVIDRLTGAIDATRKVGVVIVLLFALASITIAFATIRLAIYTARDEIGVMRLVGASNSYIRYPFVVAGMIAGLLAALIVLFILYPATWYAASATTTWLGGFSLFSYYAGNFAAIFFALVGSGVILGGLASFLAVRRYLKI